MEANRGPELPIAASVLPGATGPLRALRRAATLLATVAAGGCADPPRAAYGDDGWGPSLRPGHEAPRDESRPPAPRARPIPEAERTRWPRADELPTLAQIGGRAPSEHLDGAYERTVMVDAGAAGYANLTIATRFAPGALVVQRHHAGDEVVALYVMERLAPGDEGDWRYGVLDPALRLASTDTTLCARCHQEAPYQGLFGPPPGAGR